MVDFELRGRTAVLKLNRPEARNAVNGEVAAAMEAAIDRVEDDPEIWVAVLTHEGPVFSAGADLKAIAAGQAAALQTERGGFAGVTRRGGRSHSSQRSTVLHLPVAARSSSPVTSPSPPRRPGSASLR